MHPSRSRSPVPVLVVTDEGYVGQEGVRHELGPAFDVHVAEGPSAALVRAPSLDWPIVIVPDALVDTQGHRLLAELAALGHGFVGLLMIDDLAGVPRPTPGAGIHGIVPRPLKPGALAFHVGAAAEVRAGHLKAAERVQWIGRDLDTLRDGLRHELRGHLQTVVGLASLLLEIERPRRPANDELLDWVGRIASGGDRMTRLVDHLCDWLNLSRRMLEPGVIDLGEVVLEAIAEAKVAHQKRAARIVSLPEDPLQLGARIRADARSVGQAMRHLIDNALRFDPSETPDITVTLSAPPPPMGGWVITVSDRGPGLPEAAHARVFRLFERQSYDGTKPPGTGVGLAIVAKVAERHGGRAWIEPPGAGQGLTVHLWLPPAI